MDNSSLKKQTESRKEYANSENNLYFNKVNENTLKTQSYEINVNIIINSLKEKIVFLEEKNSKIMKENENNKKLIDLLKTENSSLKEDNKIHETKMSKFENDIKEYQLTIKDLGHKLAILEENNSKLKNELNQISLNTFKNDFMLNLLKEKEKFNKNTLNQLHNMNSEYNNRLKEVKEKFNRKEELLKSKYYVNINSDNHFTGNEKENQEKDEKINYLVQKVKELTYINECLEKENRQFSFSTRFLEQNVKNRENNESPHNYNNF